MMIFKNFFRVAGLISLVTCAPAMAGDLIPPKVYTVTPGGVSLADGSYTFSDTDLSVGPLQLIRYHLGGKRDPNTPLFGARMSHNYDIYVAPNVQTTCSPPSCTTFRKPIVHMGLTASGTFYETTYPYDLILNSSDDSYAGTLQNVAGAYVYTNQDGVVYTFSTSVGAAGVPNSRRVANIVFANGRRQDFAYNGSGQLKAVIDSSGYAIVFDYDGNGNTSAACGFNTSQTYVSVSSSCTGAAIKATYTYTGSPAKVSAVTNMSGLTTTYTYTGNEIACVQPAGYSSCKVTNSYGSPSYGWQVTQQTFIDGSIWKFTYYGDYTKQRDPEMYVDVEPSSSTIVTDPTLKTSEYDFVNTSPYSMTDANGKTTVYRYSGGWDYNSDPSLPQDHGASLVEADLPEGNKYLASYGVRRVLAQETFSAKPGSGLADLIKSYGHVNDCTTAPNTPQNCAKPIYIRDSKGNQTDFTYTSWGGVLSEMQPPPTSGAARPLKLYTYVQKYAYVKNSAGALVSTGIPIWMPSAMVQCQTVAGSNSAVCDTAATAPRLQTTYQYGADGTANNLLVRGTEVKDLVNGTTRLTCVTYDPIGRKISQTSPRGTTSISVCP